MRRWFAMFKLKFKSPGHESVAGAFYWLKCADDRTHEANQRAKILSMRSVSMRRPFGLRPPRCSLMAQPV